MVLSRYHGLDNYMLACQVLSQGLCSQSQGLGGLLGHENEVSRNKEAVDD